MRTTCRLCDSTDLELAVPVAPMPIVDGYTTTPNQYVTHNCDIYYCNDCGHAQLLDVIPAQDIFKDYLFRTGDNIALVAHYRHYADWLVKNFDTSFVVEIGCNDGTLLDMLPNASRKLGIDPSNVPCDHPKLTEFMTESAARHVTRNYGPAPLIVANHVFAHADDLNGMLDAIRIMMTSRGAFVFEVAYAEDMLDRCLYDQIEHEHLSYHSIGALIPFLNKHGLELTDYQRNDCKGGSIRCVAKPLESWHVPNYTEDCSPLRYRAFADEIRVRRDALDGMGHCIGYGAAAPCTSVMYQLGLQDQVQLLVDDNPRRHGLYSPGANIPVVEPDVLYKSDDPIVILAPRYAEQIMRRHPKLKDRFVIP